jgi:hypothetical protein
VWTVSFFAAPFIIFEERARGMDAMLKSRAYVKGHWWAVFGRMLVVMVLLIIVSVVPFGGIVFMPFMMVYMVLIYKELRTIKGRDVAFRPSGGAKAAWIGVAMLGFLVPLALSVAGGVSVYKSGFNIMELQSAILKEARKYQMLGEAPPPEEQAPTGPEAFLEPELKLDKAGFVTGETITVRFQAPSTYAANAWVGLIPSTVPHGSEAENDRRDLYKQHLNKRTSGKLTFATPASPGIYDLRMYDTDDGGSEVASVTFAVESDSPEQQTSGVKVKTLKRTYAVGEPVIVEFSGLPGYSQDWITVVPATASESTQGEWFYTGGMKSGNYTFSGLVPGSYEVRVYFDWPDGGYNVKQRYGFTVK